MRRAILLVGVALAFLGVFTASSMAADVGYVDFEFLFNAHPEYETRNEDLQRMAESLTAEFHAQAETIESDQEVQKLAEQYELQLEHYAEQLRSTIVNSVRGFIAAVAEEIGIAVVVPETMIIVGGADITNPVLEAMYNSYGISVPSHLRR